MTQITPRACPSVGLDELWDMNEKGVGVKPIL